MSKSHRIPLNVGRGLCGAAVAGLVAAALAAILTVGFLLGRWLVTSASELDRAYDLRVATEEMVFPFIGCVAVSAGAGWTAFSFPGKYRFTSSLVIIFLMSLPLWFLIGLMEVTPRRYKAMTHPVIYPSEAIVLIGPPLAASAILTVVRVRSQLKGAP